jgi:hypothetical protein
LTRTTLAILCVLALPGQAPAASPRRLAYAYDGTPSPATDAAVRRSLEDGWRLFDGLCGGRMGPAEFTMAATAKDAQVVVRLTTDIGQVAQTWMGPKLGSGYVEVCWVRLGCYSPVNQARTMAHEWMHLVYHLPDQYAPMCDRPRSDCVMGNYHLTGWPGRLCDSCQRVVDAAHGRGRTQADLGSEGLPR